jgi:hypothetical protein
MLPRTWFSCAIGPVITARQVEQRPPQYFVYIMYSLNFIVYELDQYHFGRIYVHSSMDRIPN